MSERKFTPGPWRACNKGECSCGHVWSIPHDHPVAKVEWKEWGDSYPAIRLDETKGTIGAKAEPYMEFMPYGSIPVEECKANARLIAAAPELAELVREYAWGSPSWETDDRADTLLAKIYGDET